MDLQYDNTKSLRENLAKAYKSCQNKEGKKLERKISFITGKIEKLASEKSKLVEGLRNLNPLYNNELLFVSYGFKHSTEAIRNRNKDSEYRGYFENEKYLDDLEKLEEPQKSIYQRSLEDALEVVNRRLQMPLLIELYVDEKKVAEDTIVSLHVPLAYEDITKKGTLMEELYASLIVLVDELNGKESRTRDDILSFAFKMPLEKHAYIVAELQRRFSGLEKDLEHYNLRFELVTSNSYEKRSLRSISDDDIMDTLRECGNNKAAVARKLGVNPLSLQNRIKGIIGVVPPKSGRRGRPPKKSFLIEAKEKLNK